MQCMIFYEEQHHHIITYVCFTYNEIIAQFIISWTLLSTYINKHPLKEMLYLIIKFYISLKKVLIEIFCNACKMHNQYISISYIVDL